MFNKSWKTTTAGILSIAGGLFTLYNAWHSKALNQESLLASLTAILSGVGLLFARDNDKTSEDVGAVTKEPKQ